MRVTAGLASIYSVWMLASVVYLHSAPSASEYHYWKGRALSNEEEYEKALVSFDLALAISPDNSAALDWKGHALSRLGRFEELLQVLNHQIRRSDSTSVRVQRNLAFCLKDLGRIEEAVTVARGVVSADSTWIGGHIGLGFILNAAGQPREALAAYTRATAIDSTIDEVRYHMAAIHLHLGDRAEALRLLRQMARTNPSLATDVSADSIFMDLTEEELSLLSSD